MSTVFVEDSWVRDQTQDGATSTKTLARLTGPRVIKGGRGSTNNESVKQARVAGDTKGKCRSPTERHAVPD